MIDTMRSLREHLNTQLVQFQVKNHLNFLATQEQSNLKVYTQQEYFSDQVQVFCIALSHAKGKDHYWFVTKDNYLFRVAPLGYDFTTPHFRIKHPQLVKVDHHTFKAWHNKEALFLHIFPYLGNIEEASTLTEKIEISKIYPGQGIQSEQLEPTRSLLSMRVPA